MANGLRVRDPNTGIVILEISDRLTRILGQVSTGEGPGAISVPQFSLGTGWCCVMEGPPPNPNTSIVFRYPRAIVSGTTLSWDFPGNTAWQAVPCVIQYGVY